MSDSDEADADDDPELRSLRAVWVTMREQDEEPSDRGLAALMSAAREKASTMAPEPSPTWWQRMVSVLRRPPVLALATVTVLLGGALLIGQHGKAIEPASAPLAPARAPQEKAEAAPSPVPAPGAAPSSAAIAAPETTSVAPAQRKPLAPPPKRARRVVEDAPVVAHGGDVRSDKAAEAPAPVDDVSVGGETAPATATMATQPRSQPTSNAPVAPMPSIDQLVKQCEMAAARGDCRAVRRFAAEIAKSDPGAYKTRVTRSSSLAHCLE